MIICDKHVAGDAKALADGVRGAVTYVKRIDLARYGAETRHLMDAYREGREFAGFTPLGDHVLNDEGG